LAEVLVKEDPVVVVLVDLEDQVVVPEVEIIIQVEQELLVKEILVVMLPLEVPLVLMLVVAVEEPVVLEANNQVVMLVEMVETEKILLQFLEDQDQIILTVVFTLAVEVVVL
jgi:hypothetical protein